MARVSLYMSAALLAGVSLLAHPSSSVHRAASPVSGIVEVSPSDSSDEEEGSSACTVDTLQLGRIAPGWHVVRKSQLKLLSRSLAHCQTAEEYRDKLEAALTVLKQNTPSYNGVVINRGVKYTTISPRAPIIMASDNNTADLTCSEVGRCHCRIHHGTYFAVGFLNKHDQQ